jgi:hypothetical protein
MHRRIELGLRGLSALVIVFAAVGCQTERSGTLLDWFMSAMNDPNGQGEGPITGSLEMTVMGQTLDGEIGGHYKYAGSDSAVSMTMTLFGQTTTTDTVSLDEWTYARKDQGPWIRSARKSDSPFDIDAAGGLVDKGLLNHFGRALHRLELKDPSAFASEYWIGPAEGATDGTFSLAFWAEADGTPAGMTIEATWKQQVQSEAADVSVTFDCAFESHSGVTIDVPEGAAEPSTEAYASPAELRARLDALTTIQGRVYGTYKAGDESKSLNGSVRIVDGATEIRITAGLSDNKTIWDEIVVGGTRYVSRDDKYWVNRGEKTTPTLPEVLKSAATDSDAGGQAVGGTALRCIVSPADSLDVASAFGIDMFNVSGPGSQFRVWVDTSGDPAGFGGTLVWGESVDGTPTAHSLEIDVLFEEADDTAIAAPKNPWKWIVDENAGIALALPSSLQGTAVAGWEYYFDLKAQIGIRYLVAAVGDDSAKSIAAELVEGYGAAVETRYKTTLDGQVGEATVGHVFTVTDWIKWYPGKAIERTEIGFIIAVVVPRGRAAAGFVCEGSSNDKQSKQLICDGIFATVEFLR